MSKAFTKDDADAPEVVPFVHVAPGERRLVTWDGYRAMQQELARLQEQERPQDASLEARAQGAARDARITLLQARLAAATPAQPPADQTRVFFGARVTLRDSKGNMKRWRIVGPDEADAPAGLISVESPLARAILGQAVGGEVDVELPRGEDVITVLDIAY